MGWYTLAALAAHLGLAMMSCALAQTTASAFGTTYFKGTGCDFNSTYTKASCGASLAFLQNAIASPTSDLDR
jgi:hypothetical protein